MRVSRSRSCLVAALCALAVLGGAIAGCNGGTNSNDTAATANASTGGPIPDTCTPPGAAPEGFSCLSDAPGVGTVLFDRQLDGHAPAAGDNCSLVPTEGTVERPLGDSGRYYRLHVPEGLSGTVPLLIDLHGGLETAGFAESQTGWSASADERKFIVAYPQAENNYWDAARDSADVEFIRQVVADVATAYCVDPLRIYVDGFSNGALMSQRMACDAADLFAATASLAGTLPTQPFPLAPSAPAGSPCEPSRPIGVAMIGGDFDPFMLTPNDEQSRDFWLAHNGCSGAPVTATDDYGRQDLYTACAGSVQVLWRVLANTTHGWPTDAAGDDLRMRVWNFLAAHNRS